MRLTLRKKAFAFFLLFELCMVAIFGMLLYMLQQAEAESLREERAKRIIGETQQIGLIFTKAGDGVVQYCRTHDLNSLKPFDDAAEELPKKVVWLREQFREDPKQFEIFQRVDTNVQQMMQIMQKVRGAVVKMDTMDSAALMMAARQRVQPKLDQMVKDVMQLVEAQKAIVDESPERSRKRRQQYNDYLKLGFGGTTLLAVIGLLVFFRDVIGRLQLMEDNTRRLARNKPLNPVLKGADEIAHLDVVFHDMASALKEAQEVRKAFVAMVSHDLRSPLTAVSGYLELLEMGMMGEISPQAHDGAERALGNVQRLIRLINDLLDLEKMESGTIKLTINDTSMKRVLDQSVAAVAALASSSEVKLNCEYADVQIEADEDRLIQVVVNLLSNAIKFSPEKGTVTLRLLDGGDTVIVRVIDEGRGVPEKYKDLIFERFKQVEESDHSKKGGTGLGLPICKAIIEQHGGEIGVESEEGKGSQFWFRLPRKSAAPAVVPASGELVDTAR